MGIIAATIGVGIYLLVIWKIRKDNKELEERINRNLWLEDLVLKVPYIEK